MIKDDENLSRSESFVGYKKVYKGDLVNNIMLMWKRGLGFSDFEGIVSPSYSVFKLKDRKNYYKYWNFLLRTELYKTIFKQHSYNVHLIC